MAGVLRKLAPLLACLVVAAACSTGSPGDGGERLSWVDHAGKSGGAAGRAAPLEDGLPPDEISIRLRRVASGFNAPLAVTGAGDGRRWLYVVEQDGRIFVYRDGRTSPFLDLSDRTEGGGEQGLLGLAFHPDYASNGRLFVNYTDLQGDTVIAEYRRSRRSYARASKASERVILRVDQPFANHNGGGLVFGPDGMLYVALGDGGSAGDPQGNGQRKDTLLGKVLRIDVAATPYEVPEDNPFAGRPDARGEIWAYGLRNPWRISFDRATGDLWIADVGQGEWEEVNREPAGSPGGVNYGWNVKEGRACYPAGDQCSATGEVLEDMTDPLAVYSHDHGCSVTGGFVYRGPAFPRLRGNYFFGDYCSGKVWAVAAGGSDRQQPEELLDTDLSISSFGEDDRGEVYVTDLAGGGLYRLRPAAR
ncbi:MAG: PQQ-dependent sugar dehydrogenase [Actinomycetota bacterium]|nr:PQQ-dependent sugar dehydrogenase [Actinomycetota bacterium]